MATRSVPRFGPARAGSSSRPCPRVWSPRRRRRRSTTRSPAARTSFSTREPASVGTWSNYQTILGSEGIALVVALGVLAPLTVGDFDLSIGGVFSLAGIVVASLNADHGWPVGAAIALAVLIGLGIGLLNAAL